MKRIASLLLAVLMLLSFAFMVSGETTKEMSDYTIVMIVKQSDPWFDDMEKGIIQLKEDTGLNAYVLTPESGDPALQIAIMEDLISQGVDAICIVPNDPQSLLPTIKKAQDSGIVVVTHEAPGIAESVDLDVEAFINAEFGELMGKAVVDATGGEGQFAGFVGGLTMDTHMEWYNAAVSYINANSKMTNVASEPYEDKNSIEGAYNTTIELLKAFPELTAIFDCSAHGGGISQAIKDKGRTDIKVISLAIPSMSATYIKDGSMVHGQAWRPADAGYATCYAAYLMASGQGVQTGTNLLATGYENITVDGNIAYGFAPLVFTADNIDDFEF